MVGREPPQASFFPPICLRQRSLQNVNFFVNRKQLMGAVSSVTKLSHGVYSRRVVFHESRQPEHPVVVRPTLSRASEKKKLQLWEVILSRVEDLVVVEAALLMSWTRS